MTRRTFTQDDPALPMNFPGFVFRALRKEGYSTEILLADTGLTGDDLTDPGFRCQFAPLRRLFLNALDQTGDPHLGVRLGGMFEPTFIGLPAYVAMNAERFRDALAVLHRFFFLTFPAIEFDLIDDKPDVAICLRPKFPFNGIEYFASISALVVTDVLLRAILRTETVVVRAEARVREPDGWASVADAMAFPIRFGSHEDRLYFPAELMDRPLPGADPINHRRLLALCADYAERASYETTLASRIRAFLEQAKSPNVPLAQVASALGYSERGLRRELGRLGTSFRTLMDQYRANRARDLLANSTLPIKAIADELGYDTPSNFTRSFKRWTGTTPKAFRTGR